MTLIAVETDTEYQCITKQFLRCKWKKLFRRISCGLHYSLFCIYMQLNFGPRRLLTTLLCTTTMTRAISNGARTENTRFHSLNLGRCNSTRKVNWPMWNTARLCKFSTTTRRWNWMSSHVMWAWSSFARWISTQYKFPEFFVTQIITSKILYYFRPSFRVHLTGQCLSQHAHHHVLQMWAACFLKCCILLKPLNSYFRNRALRSRTTFSLPWTICKSTWWKLRPVPPFSKFATKPTSQMQIE